MINTPQNRLNSMTHWYPILQELQHMLANPVGEVVYDHAAKKLVSVPPKPAPFMLRVPDTIFVHYPYGREIWKMADAIRPKGIDYLVDAIDFAARQLGGYPVFIRTEQSSDKHSWKDTCYLADPRKIEHHVYGLIEHSMMADWPSEFFAVRRIIPTTPVCTAFYGNMPVAKERRLFIKDGKLICNHPYWPDEAFETNGVRNDGVTDEQIADLQTIPDNDKEQLRLAAEHVSRHIWGYWSIDFLQDSSGNWWCIDMAIGQQSYHWPGCEHKNEGV